MAGKTDRHPLSGNPDRNSAPFSKNIGEGISEGPEAREKEERKSPELRKKIQAPGTFLLEEGRSVDRCQPESVKDLLDQMEFAVPGKGLHWLKGNVDIRL